jgi:putative NADH-flavin reductase
MRIVVFGANGPTGRLLTGQAVAAGHDVVAVTRRPDAFPLRHDRLTVAGADVLDGPPVDRVVAGADAVLSTLGVPFSRRPITVYSQGVRNITTAMARHGVKRIVAVSSSAAEPHRHADGGFLMNYVMQPLVVATIGKTTYADMRVMEKHLRESDLLWTVVRPSGLFDAAAVTAYSVHENEAPGIFTSRTDLAACLLDQVTDTRFVRKTLAVNTTEGIPTMWQMLRREAFQRD